MQSQPWKQYQPSIKTKQQFLNCPIEENKLVWADKKQRRYPGAGQPTQVHVYQLPVQKLNLCLDIDHDHDHDDPLCNEMMMIISTMIISLASLPRVSAEQ